MTVWDLCLSLAGRQSGFCGPNFNPQEESGLGQGHCSLVHIPGRGGRERGEPKNEPRCLEGMRFAILRCPLARSRGAAHLRVCSAMLNTSPGCMTLIHRNRPSTAILPFQQLLAHFGSGGCLMRHSAPDLLLANGIKGLKCYNVTSGVHQSSS